MISSILRWLVAPLAPFAAALFAILLATTYLDDGWGWTITLVAIVGGGIVALYGIGRLLFARWPYYAGYLVDIGSLLVVLGAGIAGALLIWAAIEKAPGDMASAREKQVWAALSAALAAYLGSLIIKPEGVIWNPVKSAISSVFGNDFTAREDDLEKDARSAVQNDRYGALASEHSGDVVSGWGWDARRLRTRHIQDQVRR